MSVEVLFDGASGTGAVSVSEKERSDVVGEKTDGHENANHGTTGLNEGMNHHGTQLLSSVVSCD